MRSILLVLRVVAVFALSSHSAVRLEAQSCTTTNETPPVFAESHPGAVEFAARCSGGKQNGDPVIVCSFVADVKPEQRGQIRRWKWWFDDGESISTQPFEALHFYSVGLRNTVRKVSLTVTYPSGDVVSPLDLTLPDIAGLEFSARFTAKPLHGLMHELAPWDASQFAQCNITTNPADEVCTALQACPSQIPAGMRCQAVRFAAQAGTSRDDEGLAAQIPLRVIFHHPGIHQVGYQVVSPFTGRVLKTFVGEVATENAPPVVGIAVNATTCNPCTLSAPTKTGFDDSSIATYHERGVASYRWDFGDGTTASGQTVSHTYEGGGTYTVALEVTDVHGGVGRGTRTVTVPNEAPVADFEFFCRNRPNGITRVCTVDPRKSRDDNGVSLYSWNFNGLSGPETATPDAVTFSTDAASSTITLTVRDHDGVSSSHSRVASTGRADRLHPLSFFAVQPCRLFDSLDTGQPIPAGVTSGALPGVKINVAGRCGIPSSAAAAAVTLIVVSPTAPGHLIAGTFLTPPDISVLNFTPERSTRASNAVVRLGVDGAFQVVPALPPGGSVHLIAEVTGYFSEDAVPVVGAAGPLLYGPLFPCRLQNTMTGPPVPVHTPLSVVVRNRCGIPPDAAGAALNVVAIQSTHEGHVTGAPSDVAWWLVPTSMLNVKPGLTPIGNGALIRLGGQGTDPDVNVVYRSAAGATTHFITDVYGYFAQTAPLKYYPLLTPCRAADTRDPTRSDSPPSPSTQIQMRGNCGIPNAARAAAVTITSVQPAGPGHFNVTASGASVPEASALNFVAGEGAIGNGLIVPLGSGRRDLTVGAYVADIGAGTGAHVIVDVHGYFGVPAEIEAELVEDLQQ